MLRTCIVRIPLVCTAEYYSHTVIRSVLLGLYELVIMIISYKQITSLLSTSHLDLRISDIFIRHLVNFEY
jgi:hypothetical protein